MVYDICQQIYLFNLNFKTQISFLSLAFSLSLSVFVVAHLSRALHARTCSLVKSQLIMELMDPDLQYFPVTTLNRRLILISLTQNIYK